MCGNVGHCDRGGRHGYCHTEAAGGYAPRWRRFATREERVSELQQYLKDLQAEAQAVQQRLDEVTAQQ